MRWSVQMNGEGGRVFGIAMDSDSGMGCAWVEEEGQGANIVALNVRPRELALTIRALQRWPLDLLDSLAQRDEAARQQDVRRRAPTSPLDETTLDSPGDDD